MDLDKLAKLMVEHGLVIRAIPYEKTYHVEVRHKDDYTDKNKYPSVVVCRPERFNREMLRVTERLSQGGKFIIAKKGNQDSMVHGSEWHKVSGKKVAFFDTIEEAVESVLGSK